MDLISVKQARSVWLFDIDDLNPKGKDVLRYLAEWIKDKYHFAQSPSIEEVLAKVGTKDSPGLVFKHGSFQAANDLFIEISNLSIHSDGVVVDNGSSTTEGDKFLEGALASAVREFGLTYRPTMIRRRLYVSTLVVKSRPGLLFSINPALETFGKRASEALAGLYGPSSPPFHLASINYWTEASDSGQHRTFSFAPQAGRPLMEGRYFSEAPLQTEAHLRLLTELEELLSKQTE